MRRREEIEKAIKNKVMFDKKNLIEAREQLVKGAEFVDLHGMNSYYGGRDITKMSIEDIELALQEVEKTEKNMDEYIKENIIAVAHNTAINFEMASYPTDFSPRLILDDNEYKQLINGERKVANNETELDDMIQEIYEFYGYEGDFKGKDDNQIGGPKNEIKASKFKEFYENSKGKLKQAFEKLKGAFNRDKRIENAKDSISNDTNNSNNER